MITEIIRDIKILLATEPYDTGHDGVHHYEVWKNCRWIVETEGLSGIDQDALDIAAWGHDLERKSETHDKLRVIMEKYGCSKEFIQKVIEIINGHSHDDDQASIEAHILFDADKIEYNSRIRWQITIQATKDNVMTQEELTHYKQAWNERMAYIPSKLHFASAKKRFQEYLDDLISWATREGIYNDGKLI